MTCCRCNRSGSCQNCSCVKSKTKCTNCLPGRLNKCVNSSTPNSEDSSSNNSTIRQDESSASDHCVSEVEAPLSNDATVSGNFTSIVTDPSSIVEPILPAPSPIAEPTFTWGNIDSTTFIDQINEAYDEITHWRMNLFLVPFGSVGKGFIAELSRLFRSVACSSALECIALKATTVLSALALQKPFKNSKAKTHVKCLERRMQSWSDGNIKDLLLEGRTIQKRISLATRKTKVSSKSRTFAKHMFEGKCQSALKMLEENMFTGVLNEEDVLPSGETVSEALMKKHPNPQGLCSTRIG